MPLNTLYDWQKDGILAAANCSDDWSKCSIVIQTDGGETGSDRFVNIRLNAAELDKVIEALQKIRKDMP